MFGSQLGTVTRLHQQRAVRNWQFILLEFASAVGCCLILILVYQAIGFKRTGDELFVNGTQSLIARLSVRLLHSESAHQLAACAAHTAATTKLPKPGRGHRSPEEELERGFIRAVFSKIDGDALPITMAQPACTPARTHLDGLLTVLRDTLENNFIGPAPLLTLDEWLMMTHLLNATLESAPTLRQFVRSAVATGIDTDASISWLGNVVNPGLLAFVPSTAPVLALARHLNQTHHFLPAHLAGVFNSVDEAVHYAAQHSRPVWAVVQFDMLLPAPSAAWWPGPHVPSAAAARAHYSIRMSALETPSTAHRVQRFSKQTRREHLAYRASGFQSLQSAIDVAVMGLGPQAEACMVVPHATGDSPPHSSSAHSNSDAAPDASGHDAKAKPSAPGTFGHLSQFDASLGTWYAAWGSRSHARPARYTFFLTYGAPLPALLLPMCFVGPFSGMVRGMVEERHSQMLAVLRALGLPLPIWYAGWMLSGLVLHAACAAMVTTLAVLTFFPATAWSVLFVVLLCFSAAEVAGAAAISALFQSPQLATFMALIIHLGACLPKFMFSRDDVTGDADVPGTGSTSAMPAYMSAASLLAPTAMGFVSDLTCAYEQRGQGLQWSMLHEGPQPLSGLMQAMLLDAVLYSVLAGLAHAVMQETERNRGVYESLVHWLAGWSRVMQARVSREQIEAAEDAAPTEMQPMLSAAAADAPALHIYAVGKHYAGAAVPAVQGVSATIHAGQITCILGHNGSGKSTLVSMISGVVQPSCGDICVWGHSVSQDPRQALQRLGLCPQYAAVYPELTALEHIQLVMGIRCVPLQLRQPVGHAALELVGLAAQAHTQAGTLSGGSKRRLQVAMAIAGCGMRTGADGRAAASGTSVHQLLVLDEPLAGVDPGHRAALYAVMQRLRAAGHAVLVTSHDIGELAGVADCLMVMRAGQLVAHGTPAQLLHSLGPAYSLNLKLKAQDSGVQGSVLQHNPSSTLRHTSAQEVHELVLGVMMQSGLGEAVVHATSEVERVYRAPAASVQRALEALAQHPRALQQLAGATLGCTSLEDVYRATVQRQDGAQDGSRIDEGVGPAPCTLPMEPVVWTADWLDSYVTWLGTPGRWLACACGMLWKRARMAAGAPAAFKWLKLGPLLAVLLVLQVLTVQLSHKPALPLLLSSIGQEGPVPMLNTPTSLAAHLQNSSSSSVGSDEPGSQVSGCMGGNLWVATEWNSSISAASHFHAKEEARDGGGLTTHQHGAVVWADPVISEYSSVFQGTATRLFQSMGARMDAAAQEQGIDMGELKGALQTLLSRQNGALRLWQRMYRHLTFYDLNHWWQYVSGSELNTLGTTRRLHALSSAPRDASMQQSARRVQQAAAAAHLRAAAQGIPSSSTSGSGTGAVPVAVVQGGAGRSLKLEFVPDLPDVLALLSLALKDTPLGAFLKRELEPITGILRGFAARMSRLPPVLLVWNATSFHGEMVLTSAVRSALLTAADRLAPPSSQPLTSHDARPAGHASGGSCTPMQQQQLISTNHPLEAGGAEYSLGKAIAQFTAALLVMLPLGILTGFYAMAVVEERQCGSHELQLGCGCPSSAYWAGHLLWDVVHNHLSISLLLVLLCGVMGFKALAGSATTACCTFGLLLAYGCAAIPFTYALSSSRLMPHATPASAMAACSLAHIGSGFGLVLLAEILPRVALRLVSWKRWLAPWAVMVFPAFCLGEGLVAMVIHSLQMSVLGALEQLAGSERVSSLLRGVDLPTSGTGSLPTTPFAWSVAGRYIFWLAVQSAAYSALVLRLHTTPKVDLRAALARMAVHTRHRPLWARVAALVLEVVSWVTLLEVLEPHYRSSSSSSQYGPVAWAETREETELCPVTPASAAGAREQARLQPGSTGSTHRQLVQEERQAAMALDAPDTYTLCVMGLTKVHPPALNRLTAPAWLRAVAARLPLMQAWRARHAGARLGSGQQQASTWSSEGVVAVRDVSLVLKPGERLGVLGTNGAGKSSLLAMLSGRDAPSEGQVWVGGVRASGDRGREQATHQRVGYCPQSDPLLTTLSAVDHIRLCAALRVGSSGSCHDPIPAVRRAVDALLRLGLTRTMCTQPVGQLSGGSRRKVSLVLALIGQPGVLLLDEPSAGLDPGAKRSLWHAVSAVHAAAGRPSHPPGEPLGVGPSFGWAGSRTGNEGGGEPMPGRPSDTSGSAPPAILLTSHDMEEAEVLCDRVAVLHAGQLAAIGTPTQLKAALAAPITAVVLVDGAQMPRVCSALAGALPDVSIAHPGGSSDTHTGIEEEAEGNGSSRPSDGLGISTASGADRQRHSLLLNVPPTRSPPHLPATSPTLISRTGSSTEEDGIEGALSAGAPMIKHHPHRLLLKLAPSWRQAAAAGAGVSSTLQRMGQVFEVLARLKEEGLVESFVLSQPSLTFVMQQITHMAPSPAD